MSTDVYYFSGTGNSLVVAREIARGTGGRAVSMATALKTGNVARDSAGIGLVFPAYMAQLSGIPLIVERFVHGLGNIKDRYIFAVCTCGGYESFNALPALKNLSRLVRSLGGTVSAEYSIRLPMNTMDYSHIPIPIDKNQRTMFKNCDRKIQGICQAALRRETSTHRLITSALNWLMTPLYLLLRGVYYKNLRKSAMEPKDSALGYRELIPLTDRSIHVTEKCKGCATCTKVCPVGNIVMREGTPSWQHHCEMCLACVEWCPNKAILHGGRAPDKSYRHPHVTLDDMIEQASV